MNNLFKFLIILLLAIFSILIMSCSPAPVYRVATVDKDVEYYYGREVVNKSDSSAHVSLSFEQIHNNNYIFYLEMTNQSGKAFILDPADIYYENRFENNGDMKTDPVKYFALDPELKLISLDKGINQNESSENTRRGLSCLVSTVDIVATVATANNKKSDEEIKRENAERENRRIADRNDEFEYKQKMDDLNSQKNYWQNDVLRKTTVHPEEKVSGFFHFTFNPKAELIKVNIPLGESEYQFDYKQVTVR